MDAFKVKYIFLYRFFKVTFQEIKNEMLSAYASFELWTND